jgi:hypothetical protein
MVRTWRLELVQERGGWTRRCIAPDGTVFFQAWGRTPLDHPAEDEARLVAHQLESGALALFDSAALANGLTVQRCSLCRRPGGWGVHRH